MPAHPTRKYQITAKALYRLSAMPDYDKFDLIVIEYDASQTQIKSSTVTAPGSPSSGVVSASITFTTDYRTRYIRIQYYGSATFASTVQGAGNFYFGDLEIQEQETYTHIGPNGIVAYVNDGEQIRMDGSGIIIMRELGIRNSTTAPNTSDGIGRLYALSGNLYWKKPNGTVVQVA